MNDLPLLSIEPETCWCSSKYLEVAEESINKGHKNTNALAKQPHNARRVIWVSPKINLLEYNKDGYQLSFV
jgi:hypothetical protein